MARRGGKTPSFVIPASRGSRRDRRLSRAAFVAGHVFGFLKCRPGVAVVITGVGARSAVDWQAGSWRPVQRKPAVTSATHDCVRGALLNVIIAVVGIRALEAARHIVNSDKRLLQNLKALGMILHAVRNKRFRCRAIRDMGLQQAMRKRSTRRVFELITAKPAGVFIVRLREDALVDHAVVADANSGVIIDSEESYPLKLAEDNLEREGVNEARNLKVPEIRRVIK